MGYSMSTVGLEEAPRLFVFWTVYTVNFDVIFGSDLWLWFMDVFVKVQEIWISDGEITSVLIFKLEG